MADAHTAVSRDRACHARGPGWQGCRRL